MKIDLADAISIIQEVLMQADASIDKETRDDALQDLQERVDDWKALSLNQLGELLLLGTFNVVKDGALRSEDKEYHIYLFSRILIMCKDVNANKPKNRLANNKPVLSQRGKPKMNLKGRIYFTNVTHVVKTSTPGNYTLQISWKSDPNTETFIVKYKNDETLQKWHNMIVTQKSSCILEAQQQQSSSNTILHSLRDLRMDNPYANLHDEDEDYSRLSGTTYGGYDITPHSEFSMSRTASNTSLQSRSTAVSGGIANHHMSAGRMPMLNTRVAAQSPMDAGNSSYFSPIERESTPVSGSTRLSAQSPYQGYHRAAPQVNGYYTTGREESYRNTAPAMARNMGWDCCTALKLPSSLWTWLHAQVSPIAPV